MGVDLEPGVGGRIPVQTRDDDGRKTALPYLVEHAGSPSDMLARPVPAPNSPIHHPFDRGDAADPIPHGIGESNPGYLIGRTECPEILPAEAPRLLPGYFEPGLPGGEPDRGSAVINTNEHCYPFLGGLSRLLLRSRGAFPSRVMGILPRILFTLLTLCSMQCREQMP